MVGYLCKVVAAQAKCRLNRGVSYLSITRLGGYFGAFSAVGYIGEQRVVFILNAENRQPYTLVIGRIGIAYAHRVFAVYGL